MPGIQRFGDINNATPTPGVISSSLQSTVNANGRLVSVNGSTVSAHSGGPTHINVVTTNGCSTVRVGGIPINKVGDADSCGHVRIQNDSNVFICSFSGGGAYIDHNAPYSALGSVPSGGQPLPSGEYSTITVGDVEIYDNNNDDPNPDETAIGAAPTGMQIKPDINQVATDPTPAPTLGSPSAPSVGSPNCAAFEALPASFNWTSIAGTFAAYAGTTSLSSNFTVADLTINTAVSYYPFTSAITQTSGYSQKEILLNLCYHTSIILEPLLADSNVPPFTITSGFRNKSGGSQHNKGQATDLQFIGFHDSSSTGAQYYTLAQYIRDNFNYDQLILEWFGRNPWIHISSNSTGHRGSVLTQVARTSYQPGLIQIG